MTPRTADESAEALLDYSRELDALGRPGVPDFALAASRVLAAHLDQPEVALFGPAQMFVGGVGHSRGAEGTAAHELNGYFALLVGATGLALHVVQLVAGQPALGFGAGIVDANHERIVLTNRL